MRFLALVALATLANLIVGCAAQTPNATSGASRPAGPTESSPDPGVATKSAAALTSPTTAGSAGPPPAASAAAARASGSAAPAEAWPAPDGAALAQASPASDRAPLAQASPPAAQATADDGGSYPGPYFLGRAEAPVVLEEYADFQ